MFINYNKFWNLFKGILLNCWSKLWSVQDWVPNEFVMKSYWFDRYCLVWTVLRKATSKTCLNMFMTIWICAALWAVGVVWLLTARTPQSCQSCQSCQDTSFMQLHQSVTNKQQVNLLSFAIVLTRWVLIIKWMNEWMFNDSPAWKTDQLLGVIKM